MSQDGPLAVESGGSLQYSGIPDPSTSNGSLKGSELSELLRGLQGVRRGDFSVRLPAGWPGLMGEIADCFNDIVSMNQRMAEQIDRVGQVVGHEGRTRE